MTKNNLKVVKSDNKRQQELKEKSAKIKFLEQQLEYKSMGPPDADAVDTQTLFTKSRNLR